MLPAEREKRRERENGKGGRGGREGERGFARGMREEGEWGWGAGAEEGTERLACNHNKVRERKNSHARALSHAQI